MIRILRISLPLIFLVACSSPDSDNVVPDSSADTLSLTGQAWVMRDSGASAEEFLAVQRQAVEQMRRGESPDAAVAVLDQMGLFSYVAGDYVGAADYYQEALDSLISIPPHERPEEVIQLFGDMSLLYSELGMNKEAIAYSDSAVRQSLQLNGRLLPDVYRFRSDVFFNAGDTVGAMECFDLALEALEKYPTVSDGEDIRLLVECGKASAMIDTDGITDAELQWAVNKLESATDFDLADSAQRRYFLGMGYVRQGRAKEGLSLMEKAMREFEEQGDMEALQSAMAGLMRFYSRFGMDSRLAALYPSYVQLNDSLLCIRKAHYLIGASILHKSETQAEYNRMLNRQLALERESRARSVSITVLCVIVFMMVTLLLYRRYREVRTVSRNQAGKITNLTRTQKMLSRQIQTLQSDLNDEMHSNSQILSEPHHLSSEEQGRFRRAFISLYPHFLEILKSRFPSLTPNDELLCMLIYLRHTTSEITVFLGISHTSVNTARYRLRQKLNLSKDRTLDGYLAEITPPNR